MQLQLSRRAWADCLSTLERETAPVLCKGKAVEISPPVDAVYYVELIMNSRMRMLNKPAKRVIA